MTASSPRSYHQDWFGWTLDQAQLLREQRFADLDLANLIEEIESMGRSEYDQLETRLAIRIGHLLKWEYQPRHRSGSWQSTIREQRRKLARLLGRSPSLKSRRDQALTEAWEDGLDLALRETGLDPTAFPADLPYGWERLLDQEFWPGQPDERR